MIPTYKEHRSHSRPLEPVNSKTERYIFHSPDIIELSSQHIRRDEFSAAAGVNVRAEFQSFLDGGGSRAN